MDYLFLLNKKTLHLEKNVIKYYMEENVLFTKKKDGRIMAKILLVVLAFLVLIGGAFGVLYLKNEENAKEMMEYIDTFTFERSKEELVPQLDENGNWYFTTDEDFKVLHLTDVHITGGFLNKEQDKKAINAVAAMIVAEEPDLVVVTGDIAFAIPTTGTIDNRYAHNMFIRLMENLGVYWTVTFGNHDDEAFNNARRKELADMYADESLEKCLFMQSPEGVAGMGNHVINVKNTDGKVTKSLFMIDTHSYVNTDLILGTIDAIFWNYDSIKQSQIDWYKGVVETYQPMSSLLFFHIPLAEVKDAYDEYIANDRTDTDDTKWHYGVDGEDRTDEVVFASRLEDEFFETILELGNTKGMFFGHDHCNNFIIEYKGVLCSYGYSIDYSAYEGDLENKGLQRGCTVLVLTPDGEFTAENIIHENYYQDKYQPLYQKEEVEMTPLYNN